MPPGPCWSSRGPRWSSRGPRGLHPGPPPAPKEARADRTSVSFSSSLEEASPHLLRVQPPPSGRVVGASRPRHTAPAAQAAPLHVAAPPRGSVHEPNSHSRRTILPRITAEGPFTSPMSFEVVQAPARLPAERYASLVPSDSVG
ncbi:hypothetical protein NDU88_006409 [Pleurodeles waltl]|uniref:Uncharacterized protein n=1 Tax=Pleurodeles waltl TaxID=8319 RepID=A0AAV7N8J6_PLEWA|nr:hypothetical protein NDU88_006409 [Pleurodeles waltl]